MVILNRREETPAQFSNYLPNWERTERKKKMNFDLWFFVCGCLVGWLFLFVCLFERKKRKKRSQNKPVKPQTRILR